MHKWVFLTLLIPCISGCSTDHIVIITPSETLKPIEADLDGNYKSVELRRVVSDISIGTVLGHTNQSSGAPLFFCNASESILTNSLTRGFQSTADRAGYRVIGNSGSLFDDFETGRAEIVLGARITDYRQNRTNVAQLWDWKLTIEQYIEIEWQAYSRQLKSVILTCKSTAYHKDSAVYMGTIPIDNFIDNLTRNAVNNLFANREFIEVLRGNIKSSNGKEDIAKRQIKKVNNLTKPISESASQIRSSVITVGSKVGHGSGFIVHEDGYALTNAHVVGRESIVRVTFATGREFLADVLYRESERDVALIKIEQGGFSSLPIKLNALNVGAEVYAMGSPLDEALSGTLTKGIVSAFRKENELNYIQSDVNIQPGNSGGPLMDKHGNVVGISVKGLAYGRSPIPIGINYFIPIEDAIKAVGIELTD